LILVSVIVAIGTVGAQTGGMWGSVDSNLKGVGFGTTGS
jgi:hypothetical protein